MGQETIIIEGDNKLLNSPLELGLRALFILNAVGPQGCDLDRMCIYDYLLTHSSDVEGGPPSLHPAIPHRAAEVLVKKGIMEKGLLLMQSKDLINASFGSDGITFKANKLTQPFLAYQDSAYAKNLLSISEWLAQKFANYSNKELNSYVNGNLEIWGGEFIRESIIRTTAL